MTADCPHPDFAAQVDVQRIGDADRITNYVAEISVRCSKCGEPFHFVGDIMSGFSFTKPTVNVGATTLHAPIAPGVGPMPTGMRFEMPARSKA